MTLIKSISGIRGTIGGMPGNNLTPIDVVKFTTAYARFLGAGEHKLTICVGRDARLSGELVEKLVHGALLGAGADVIDLGMCTTPGVEVAVTTFGADGGIIITASHNPRQWNALKLLGGNGEFLNAEEGNRVLELAEDQSFAFPEIDAIGKVVKRVDFNNEHIEKVLALPVVEVEKVRKRHFRVVVDAVNSVGGIVIPELLRRLGCDVVEINCEPTGEFAHNPEPLPEHLTEISAAVVSHKADLGVVVDPDVDRLALVCEDGTMFGEEYTLIAAADYVISKTYSNSKNDRKKLCTVSNLSSSRALSDLTQSLGGEYFSSSVGEVHVVSEMKRVSAVIGGEGNGGVIYPELHYGRDALVGIALILSLLAERNVTLKTLRAAYPQYFASKNKITLTEGMDPSKVLDEIKHVIDSGTKDERDGLKIDFPDSWVHLRRSNTEPIIRVYAEAHTQKEADELASQFVRKIEELTL